MLRRSLVFAAALLLLSLAAWAHAYHASIMELRVNPDKQQLEISLKVFTDDLEKALSEGQPRPVSLEQSPAGTVQPLLAAYLRQRIGFTGKPGEALPLSYLGMQRENDAHWLFCTVKLPRPLRGVQLQHRLLLEHFADQMNIVNLEAGGKKQSALFRDGHDTQLLSW
ncbi:DUF6702 family protein [Hymenobacter sp. B81]|uniref:DUF6702 family protein n=1 Tax=Hymenobacter sp. B81 TaxID=3344878 RepID=UPI0037DD7C63